MLAHLKDNKYYVKVFIVQTSSGWFFFWMASLSHLFSGGKEISQGDIWPVQQGLQDTSVQLQYLRHRCQHCYKTLQRIQRSKEDFINLRWRRRRGWGLRKVKRGTISKNYAPLWKSRTYRVLSNIFHKSWTPLPPSWVINKSSLLRSNKLELK